MSSIRVKRIRAPLADVPVQQGRVAEVPTEILPSPKHRDSPVNHEFLVEHARGPAGTSGAPMPRPRPERAASIPQDTTRRRSKTLGALESGETSALIRTTPISSAPNFQRRSRSSSGSWFVDHVANSSIDRASGRSVLQSIPSRAHSVPLARGRSMASNATLEVTIPEEVRTGLAGKFQNRDLSFTSLGSEVHPDDIVDHLSVIGTSSIRHFTSGTILKSR